MGEEQGEEEDLEEDEAQHCGCQSGLEYQDPPCALK